MLLIHGRYSPIPKSYIIPVFVSNTKVPLPKILIAVLVSSRFQLTKRNSPPIERNGAFII